MSESLFDYGILVNLRISAWSARKMVTRNDLLNVGIDPSRLPSDVVALGRKLLVPKEDIRRINLVESRARIYLSTWSMPFEAGNSHFVPSKVIDAVEAKLSEYKQEFNEVADDFVSRLEKMKEILKEKHSDFWEKCLKNCYPVSGESLRQKFNFRWYKFKIASASLESVSSEEIELARKELNKEAMLFAKQYVESMRKETINFCELMSCRINGRPYGDETEAKKLTNRSLGFFKKFVERFGQMNLFGDDEIAKMLSEFKDKFLLGENVKSEFENDHVRSAITKTLQEIAAKAADLGEQVDPNTGLLRRKIII